METTSAVPVRKRRLSFSLRTLLIIAPILAIGFSLAFRIWYADFLQEQAVAEVRRLGGDVVRNEERQVIRVELAGKQIDDAQLGPLVTHLARLPKLQTLILASNDITDKGLVELARLPQLQTALLADTKVTQQGIDDLKARAPALTIEMQPLHLKASGLASRDIFPHALLSIAAHSSGTIVSGSGDGRVHIWKENQRLSDSFAAHADWTFAVAFHPQRTWLATAGGDGQIVLWNWPSLEKIARFTGHADDVHGMAFTSDGRTLVSSSDDRTIRVWDVATQSVRHVLEGHDDSIPGLAIGPDDQTVAAASRDGTIGLWNIESGKTIGSLLGHRDDVMAVAFHPSQPLLASASYDRSVIVWDLRTKKVQQTIPGHDDDVYSVAWSPRGDRLASAAGDGLRLWDPVTGRLMWHVQHQPNVSHVHWLDDSRIASSSANGSVAVQSALDGRLLTLHWADLSPQIQAKNGLVLAENQ